VLVHRFSGGSVVLQALAERDAVRKLQRFMNGGGNACLNSMDQHTRW
jgi:hypothetical protein